MRTALTALLLPLFASYAAAAGVSVRLAEVKGEVSARATSASAWVQVKDGAMLAPGGQVKTAAGSSVVLAFSNNNKVKLAPRTTFGIDGATSVKTSLRLFSGKIHAWVRRANKSDFIVRHSAGVAAVRGTIFMMEGTAAGLKIGLFEGALDIIDNYGRPSNMSPGQNAQMSKDAGLEGISSMPPGTKAPEEPKVAAPPPVAAVAPADKKAPEDIPDDGTQAEGAEDKPADDNIPPPTNPKQEKDTECAATVSPSAPCP